MFLLRNCSNLLYATIVTDQIEIDQVIDRVGIDIEVEENYLNYNYKL